MFSNKFYNSISIWPYANFLYTIHNNKSCYCHFKGVVFSQRGREGISWDEESIFLEVDVVLLVCDLLRCLKLLHDEIAADLHLCTQTWKLQLANIVISNILGSMWLGFIRKAKLQELLPKLLMTRSACRKGYYIFNLMINDVTSCDNLRCIIRGFYKFWSRQQTLLK